MSRVRASLLAAVVVLVTAAGFIPVQAATGPPAATRDIACARGSHPESMQGRAPMRDYKTGRAAIGYMCNATEVSHIGDSGGYRTYRYVDSQHHVCGFYD